MGRPHNQTQILLTIIFNTLFKEGSATIEVSAGFVKDSIRYTCIIISGSAFLDFLDHIFILKGSVFPFLHDDMTMTMAMMTTITISYAET